MKPSNEQIREQWGIPDWRDTTAYVFTECSEPWRTNLYRWEFLRRRPDYREDWLRYLPQTVKTYRKGALADPWKVAAEFGSVNLHNFICTPEHPEYRVHMAGSVEKYRLAFLINPVFANLQVTFVSTSEPGVMEPGQVVKSPIRSIRWIVPKDCCAIAFNYRLPLKPQLERAEQNLQMLREFLQIRNTNRKRPNKYLDYLRALDAEANGATYEEICKVLSPGKKGTTLRARGEEIVKAAHNTQDALT